MNDAVTIPVAQGALLNFLAGGGEIGARMRGHDWAATPLGPPETWPQSLKIAVRIMLTSRQPIWIGWGKELTYLYNDAYKTIIGGKHPWALGRPTTEVWREIWDDIGPMLATAMTEDEGTYVEEQLLIMERNGYPEETYYTFSYSPVPKDEGSTGGIICANADDTQRVIGERQLALLRDLAASTADARSWRQACERSTATLATNSRDLPFAMLYMAEPDGLSLSLVGAAGIEPGHAAAPASVPLTAPSPWPFAEVLRHPEMRLIADLAARFGQGLPTGSAWTRAPVQAVMLPVSVAGAAGRAGVLVVGLNPFRLFDEGYRQFLGLMVGQITAAIANADAYEEERRRAEALAELDRAKTAFFANVSHEFRTPLTLMIGPLEEALAGTGGRLPLEERGRIEVAHRNALRLLRLVNSLLDFSRVEAGRAQARYAPTDLAPFTAELASSFRSLCERAGLALEVDCPPLPGPAFVDREMWEKIVLNLLSNAFKFTLQGGIAVSLRPSADGKAITLSVRDTGTGIPAAELPHLFERFHRVEGAMGRSYEGSGIGLALVRELVRLHGGEIQAESELGRGSAFTVTLPFGAAHLPAEHVGSGEGRLPAPVPTRAAAYVEEAQRWLQDEAGADALPLPATEDFLTLAPPVPPDGSRGKGHVLVVDDNADMREYMRRLLAGRGYEVEAVADGVAALEAARQRRPDLVLSDVMMPRLDGFGLLRTLRAEPALAEVPVVLLSARAGEEARVEGLDAGADDYLIKPFSARELVARIGASLSLTRVRREAAEEVRARSVELEAVLATVPAGVWFTRDADARRVWGNRHAAELLRLPEGANASLAAPEEERPSFRVFRDGVEATPETLPMLRAARGEEVRGDEQEIRFADGAPPVVLLCHATPLRDGEGRAAGAVCAAVDITDRRRAEEAQRESETRLLDLLATLDLGASMARDLDGTIRFWSEGCARLYGWSTAEVAGRDAHALLRTVFPVPQAEIEAALEREGEWIGDLRQWTRDGRGVIVAARKMLRRAADGRPVAVLESLTDVTAQRQAEAALVEALEAREVLLHEVNHRVKNSLQLVSSLLSLQASRSADQDLRAGLAEARGRIGVVSQVHRRLYQAGTHGRIDDLASFLQELCDDTVAALDQEGRISLEFAAPADEGAGAERAPIDRAVPLALILSELVTNAVKYAFPDGRGGTIRVSVRRVEEEGGALVVSVEDDGIGLPEGFEPIASRGVGMRVVVVLVRQLRARLEVRRTYPEGGASFVVVMPPTEPGADDAAAEGA